MNKPNPKVRMVGRGDFPDPTEFDFDDSVIPGASRVWGEADGTFYGTASSHAALPPGLYRTGMDPNRGFTFTRLSTATDTLVELPDSESETVLDEIEEFGRLRPKFAEYGFLYKRGILLWGPPGSGKTATLQLAMRRLVSTGSIGIMVDHPGVAAGALQELRKIEPERRVVALMEDFDALCQQYDESAYLSLLDGEAQVDNIVFIATSNYPERLDKRFTDRPSRFDTIRYIGMPTGEARRAYLAAKVPQLPQETAEQIVAASAGYSIAHLRELVILTQCFGRSVEGAVERVNKARFEPPDSGTTVGPVRPSTLLSGDF